MIYAEIATKLGIALIGLWTMTKLLGKKEVSQLTAFDFISSLMLSELVGNTIYDEKASVAQLLFAMILWTLMTYALEKLAVVFPWLSKRVSGNPELIIKNGLVDERALKRNNLSLDQLHMLLRAQGVFGIRQVAYAIFETNGSLSVLRKPADGEKTLSASLPVIVISNGQIDKDGLRYLGKDVSWLNARLRKAGITSKDDILYAEWSDEFGLHAQQRHDPRASFSFPVG